MFIIVGFLPSYKLTLIRLLIVFLWFSGSFHQHWMLLWTVHRTGENENITACLQRQHGDCTKEHSRRCHTMRYRPKNCFWVS